jgi:hypothetical protein
LLALAAFFDDFPRLDRAIQVHGASLDDPTTMHGVD